MGIQNLFFPPRLRHAGLRNWCPALADLCRRRSSSGDALRCGASRGTWGCAGPSVTCRSSCTGSRHRCRCGRACGGAARPSGRRCGGTGRSRRVSPRCGSSGDILGFLGDGQRAGEPPLLQLPALREITRTSLSFAGRFCFIRWFSLCHQLNMSAGLCPRQSASKRTQNLLVSSSKWHEESPQLCSVTFSLN